MKRVSLVAMLVLSSCQSDRPSPKIVLGPKPVEPMWSTYVGCSGGIEFSPGAVTVARRIVDEYEIWKFDAASGTLLNYATKSTRIGRAPNDTPADLTGGSTKPLDASKVGALTPPGFTPVVATDRFLFARRTRTRLQRLKFYSEGQAVLIDRPSGKAVWMDEGLDVAVIAALDRVIVCRDGQTSVFARNAGRPPEASEFYTAIRAGDISVLRKLYPAWRGSRIRDVDGKVPLSVAAKDGRLDIVKLLVGLGEPPNSADADGFTPLMMALHWNHSDIAEFLLDAGAIPTDDAPPWGSALRIAVHEGRRTIVSRLLRAGAKIDLVETRSGRTALHEAVMYRNYEAIEVLISGGASIKARSKDGKTPGELAPGDQCVVHLFGGGLIKERPSICRPIKRETATFVPAQPLH